MDAILQRCIELDRTAQETYARMASACQDADLRRTFERMGAEEWAHVEWWTELRDAYRAGRVPAVIDEADMRATVEDASLSMSRLLDTELESLDPDQMLTIAIRMEFFMLDPAFGELIELLDPGTSQAHRDAYSRHVMRLVTEIENRHADKELASFLARVLQRTYRDQERLTTLATRDPLTGLFNRRGFYNYLAQWCAWSHRYGHALGVLLIDVDHFKTVNDTFGHPAGDEALCSVARALERAVRDSDLVGRYGGDEFAVLAPEASQEALGVLAKRILSEVRAAELPGGLSAIKITVSVGAAFVRGDSSCAPEALLSLADKSLYLAKDAGRDCASPALDVSATPPAV